MLGYSEADAIYFTAGDQTGFARVKPGFTEIEKQELAENQLESIIESGSFKGTPKFKYLDWRKGLCHKTKQCHSAEHKTYNAFQKKIKNLRKNTSIQEFKKFIPSLDEIKKEGSFSLFCGTSFIASSSIAIILMSLPNLFHYKNTDLVFMPLWLIFSLLSLYVFSYLIQSRYLAEPSFLQIFIAQKALKEVLNGNNN